MSYSAGKNGKERELGKNYQPGRSRRPEEENAGGLAVERVCTNR